MACSGENGGIGGKDDQALQFLELEHDNAPKRWIFRNVVAFSLEYLDQRSAKGLGLRVDRADRHAVAALERRLVEQLDGLAGLTYQFDRAAQHDGIAQRIAADLQTGAGEHIFQPEHHGVAADHSHRDLLEHRTVRHGYIGQGAAADQQRQAVVGGVVGCLEIEHAFALGDSDAIIIQHEASGSEDVRRGLGIVQAQRHQVALALQRRRDAEGQAQAVAKHLVDEGRQRKVVQVQADRRPGEVLAQGIGAGLDVGRAAAHLARGGLKALRLERLFVTHRALLQVGVVGFLLLRRANRLGQWRGAGVNGAAAQHYGEREQAERKAREAAAELAGLSVGGHVDSRNVGGPGMFQGCSILRRARDRAATRQYRLRHPARAGTSASIRLRGVVHPAGHRV